MIERHGTHVCKNPDCCGMIAWTVFLQNDRLKDDFRLSFFAVLPRCRETDLLRSRDRARIRRQDRKLHKFLYALRPLFRLLNLPKRQNRAEYKIL